MAKLTQKDIRDFSNDELLEKIEAEQAVYRDRKFFHTISTLENPLQLRHIRRDVARLETEKQRRKGTGEL